MNSAFAAFPWRAAVLVPAVVVGLVLLLSPTTALGQGTGRSLDIQPGGRQNGMGAAGAALPGDPSDAMWWNPALLGFGDRLSFQLTRAQLVPGLADHVFHYHAAAAVPMGSFAGVGASYTHLDYGESQGTDYLGRPTGSFTSSEESGAVGVGIRIPLPGIPARRSSIAVGATLKRIHIDLAPRVSARTHGIDIGTAIQVPLEGVTLGAGLCYQNLGGEATFVNPDQPSPLSRNLKAGVSAVFSNRVAGGLAFGGAVVADYNQSLVTDAFNVWNGGVEFSIESARARVAARGGYYYDRLGEIEDFTFGTGLRMWMVSVDAGWIPQARDLDLDRVLKLTMGVNVPLGSKEDVLAHRAGE